MFGTFPVAQSVGVMLAHRLVLGAFKLGKGHLLTAEDVRHLQSLGVTTVVGARLGADELAENPASEALATLLAGANVVVRPTWSGRCNLHAAADGLLVLAEEPVIAANDLDESIAIGTLPPWSPVRKGQVIATVKIITCALRQALLEKCQQIFAHPPVRIAAWQPRRAALIVSRVAGQRSDPAEATAAVMQQRLAQLQGRLALRLICEHTGECLVRALRQARAAGCDLILISGGQGTKDRGDTVPAAILQAGGRLERFGIPVEPGNMLLLAWLDEVPVLVMPGCARSRRLNGLDWVLQRLAAGLPLERAAIARMGIGGLIRHVSETLPLPDSDAEKAPVAPARLHGAGGAETRAGAQVAILVLAAGCSRRMAGENKLLLPWGGVSLAQRATCTALASRASSVTVVTGHEAEAVAAQVRLPGATVVHNPDYLQGMASSLRCGIEALPGESAGVLVLLADMPLVDVACLDRLIDVFEGQSAIIVPVYQGQRGNPVLWPRRYFDEIRALKGDQGARHLLEQHADAVVTVEMTHDGVLKDIDSPQDRARLPGLGRFADPVV